MKKIRAQRMASFLERDGHLQNEDLLQVLEAYYGYLKPRKLDCYLRSVDDKNLTIHFENEKVSSECFDMRYIDDIYGYTCKPKGSKHIFLFVFRYLASQLADGDSLDELHIFTMKNVDDMKSAANTLHEAVNNAKKDRKKKNNPVPKPRIVVKQNNYISKPQRIPRLPRNFKSLAMEKIRVQHIASFQEDGGRLQDKGIFQSLKIVYGLLKSSRLDCTLRIVDDQYLAVYIENETEPSECFDMHYIDNIFGYPCKSKGSKHTFIFVFRFLASQLTNGESPDEVHVFKLESERDMQFAVDILCNYVNTAKQNSQSSNPALQPCTILENKAAISKARQLQLVSTYQIRTSNMDRG